MPTIDQTRYDKLHTIIETRCGGSKTRFAEKMGITKQYVSNITRALSPRPIGKALARKVEQVFELDSGWMDEMSVSASFVEDDSSIEIPLLDVRGHLAPGMDLDISREVVRKIWINTQYLRDEVRGVSVKNLAVITGKGDSMQPTISRNTPLLIDTSVKSFDEDAIYVFSDGNKLFINRIQREIGGGGVTVLSDNPAYPPKTISEEALPSIKILGRVIRKVVFETL